MSKNNHENNRQKEKKTFTLISYRNQGAEPAAENFEQRMECHLQPAEERSKNTHGISMSLLIKKAEGDTEQPFAAGRN